MFDGFLEPQFGSLVPKETSLQICLMSHRVNRAVLGQVGLLLLSQMQLDSSGHSPRHLVLHRKYVLHAAIIVFSPKVSLVLHSNQLHGKAQVGLALAEATFQDILDGELSTNLV